MVITKIDWSYRVDWLVKSYYYWLSLCILISLIKHILEPKCNKHQAQVISNNNLDTVTADTGARVSVCRSKLAKKWNHFAKLVPWNAQIKPYKNAPISVYGKTRWTVSFGESSIPVVWHVSSCSFEPVLDGNTALHLRLWNPTPNLKNFNPLVNDRLITEICKWLAGLLL